MDSSPNHQWLIELEKDELEDELDFVDHLSMQQLAESLANDLLNRWDQQQHAPSPTGFSFIGDANNAEGIPTAACTSKSMFSFPDGSAGSLNFSGQQQEIDREGASTAGEYYCLLPSEKRERRRRASSSVQEHVISERKRREMMHQQFATLASIIPDITKTDKVSLLGSTIEYVHKLKERMKALKEHQTTASMAESSLVFLDARCCLKGTAGDHDDGAADNNIEAATARVVPRVEASMRGTTVLLRIACQEKKGVLIMVLTELEKHGLSVSNTGVVPFGDSSLDITVTAEIEDGFSTTAELVKDLHLALKKS